MGPHLPDTMANSSSTQARASIPEVSMPVASPKQNLHQAQIQSQEAQMANEAKPNSQALPPFDGPYNKTQAASLNQCAPTHMGRLWRLCHQTLMVVLSMATGRTIFMAR